MSNLHKFTEQEILNGSITDNGNGSFTINTNATLVADSITIDSETKANTTGGVSTYSAQGGTSNALLTNTAVLVSAGAHNLYGIDLVNTGAATTYVQIFDAASAGAVTLGTTVPKLVKWVSAGGAWEEKFSGEGKILFASGIVVAATTTPTGSTAPATGINANITYF